MDRQPLEPVPDMQCLDNQIEAKLKQRGTEIDELKAKAAHHSIG